MKRIFVISFCLFAMACSADATNDGDDEQSQETPELSMRQLPLEADETCPAGGVSIETGIDDNGNDKLDDAEVSETYVVCHGDQGEDGTKGDSGDDGEQGDKGDQSDPGVDGKAALIEVVDELPGDNCPFGGSKVISWVDDDGEGDPDELDSLSTRYVCNGANPDAWLGFDLQSPIHGGPIAADSYVSYTLASELTSLTFTRTLVSGTGPAESIVVLSGDNVSPGLHEGVVLDDEALLNGDTYDLTIQALTLDGATVDLTPVFGLVVDDTPPVLLSAQTIQAEFGHWNAGDKLVFRFSEPISGGLSSLVEVASNLADQSSNTYDYFSDALLVFGPDQSTLTLTLSAGDSSPTLLYSSGVADDPANALFDPTDLVTDLAGNPDGTPLAVELMTDGDLTAPKIWIKTPKENGSTKPEAVVAYNLSEDLAEGQLTVIFQPGAAVDELVTRGWTLDAQRLKKGEHSIDFQIEGIAPLVDGASYIIRIEGSDGAGNWTVDEVAGVWGDGTAPDPPNESFFFVQNHINELSMVANETDGQPGDTLRFYVEDVLVGEMAFPGPYGFEEIQTLLSGLDPIPADAAIHYSYIDEAGNESSKSSDGVIPVAPPVEDLDKLGIRLGTTTYKLIAEELITASVNVLLSFERLPDPLTHVGSADGGGLYTPIDDAIDSLTPDATVYYLYENANGHISDFSEKDGQIVQLNRLEICDFDFNAKPSSNDIASVGFSGGVTVPSHINDRSGSYCPDYGTPVPGFAYGTAPATVGQYEWPASLSEIQFAPVSMGVANTFWAPGYFEVFKSDYLMTQACYGGAAYPSLYGSDSGDSFIGVFMMFAGFSGGYVNQLVVELAPRGTDVILSHDSNGRGGHSAQPSAPITPGGTSGGVLSPDIDWDCEFY